MSFGLLQRITLLAAVVAAIAGGARAAKYPLLEFPELQGLTVRDVLQDSAGSIWLATDRGLWRWADQKFVAETTRGSGPSPTSCLLDDERHLWVGLREGLIRLDPASRMRLPGPPELADTLVYAMLIDAAGDVWCGTKGGLYHVRTGGDMPHARLITDTADQAIFSLAIDASNRLWAGSRGSVLCFKNGTACEPDTFDLPGGEVRGLAVAADGALWIGLRDPGGLYRLGDTGLEPIPPSPDNRPPQVNAITRYGHEEIWVGTDRGVLRHTERGVVRIDRDTGLTHDGILALFVDREELIWIATRGGGVCQLQSPHILTQDVYDGLPHPVVQSVLPRPGGEFIVGTAAGLCRVDAAGQIVQRFPYLGDAAALHADERGRIWVGGRTGLVCFDENRGGQLDIPDIRTLKNVNGIAANDNGGVLVSTVAGVWNVVNDTISPEPQITAEGDAQLHINGMFPGPHGVVYLATRTGVFARSAGRPWEAIPGSSDAHSVATDRDGRVWVGTSQGIMRVEDGYCRDFSRRSSPYGTVTDIAADPAGGLWLATPAGLYRFDGTRFTAFNAADGLPSDDVRCVKSMGTGLLLVGTAQGLALVESDHISRSMAPPRVEITMLKAGGEQYVIGNAPVLVPNWQRNVVIGFQNLGFRRDPKGLRYSSRLLGFEDEWSAPSHEPARSFTNLPWGDYEFQVKGRNTQGLESDRIASVRFTVGPPVWLGPWFVSGCVVVFAAFCGWVIADRRKKLQLRRAAQAANVAKSEFLAKVSHEIRTPLTVILGCTEHLTATQQKPAAANDSIDAISRNSEHLLTLINDLLDLSKIEAGKLSVELAPASVHEIVMEVEAIMRASAERVGLAFEVVYETDIPDRIVTDSGRLRQALINLVGNAIKFTPAGRISLRVRVSGAEGGRRLVFDVEDTGVGIPPDKLSEIFEAFAQAESSAARQFAGSGLGLAISRSITERIHGTLSVRSEPRRGSTFTLSIDLNAAGVETLGLSARMLSPSVLAATKMPSTATPAPDHLAALSGRVLLAEDDKDISRIMRTLLESAGAQVAVVDNGPGAVELARSGEFDVVVMDIHMPGMDGISAIKLIRSQGIETAIVVISADSSEQRHRECDDAGADGFMPKPFQGAAFVAEIRRHLTKVNPDKEHAMDDAISCDLDLSSPKMAAAIAEFAAAMTDRLQRMNRAFEQGDNTTLAELAHQLKGAGGINGYMCVTERTRHLEAALRDSDGDAVKECLTGLRHLSERISAGLQAQGIDIPRQ